MQFIAIVLLSVGAAVLYGILHDQVTIRICPEYFTVFHPHVADVQSLTVLAIIWGVIATWWVGLPLGIVLGLCARTGRWPRLSARELIKPTAVLLVLMGVAAALGGVTGWILAVSGTLRAWPWLADNLAESRHAGFFADLLAHNVSYFGGAIGGLVLSGWVLMRRRRLARRGPDPDDGTAHTA
ncbi:MAG TPA: hypothetical protein VG797_00285 [Phycisphaerales bacterium]|nr:hypothetical protein [Phycisphaerales bacterium]